MADGKIYIIVTDQLPGGGGGEPQPGVEKKEKDQFDDFVEKQKEARAKGIKYSYGDYQKERHSPIDIPKPKTDPDKMQCQDCKHFVAGMKDQNKCVMKPYTRDGKRRFYPQRFQKACKTYFEQKK